MNMLPWSIALRIVWTVAGASSPQDGELRMPAGPVWGEQTIRPTDANAVFSTADGCAHCHGRGWNAETLVGPTGEDVTPYGLWRGSVMAHSFVDPYFRGQLERELDSVEEPGRPEVAATCLRCHAPMIEHTRLLMGEPPLPLQDADVEPLALDGVSCTVCHQARAPVTGVEASFNGRLDIRPGRRIFGPYRDPNQGPMAGHSAYLAVYGEHLSSSEMCASCHVLRTEHGAGRGFLEQATYLEWRNSAYASEADGGIARTCQDCHMPRLDATAVRDPALDLPISLFVRPQASSHATVGGNAFLLDLMRRNAERFSIETDPADLERMAALSRRLLARDTARLHIENLRREGERLVFDVRVENLAGHKLPSGYPSRRVFLSVALVDPFGELFHSGEVETGFGRIRGVEDPLAIPHRDRVERSDEVVVYEMVGADAKGRPTTKLSDMVRVLKDNRLLPRGWKPDGPFAGDTAPVGTEGDGDFVPGGDTVTYAPRVPRLGGVEPRLFIRAELLYQPIPPAWALALDESDSDAAQAFVSAYLRGDPAPERLAEARARWPAGE